MPLFLAHDGENPLRAAEITARFNATTYAHWRDTLRLRDQLKRARTVGEGHDLRLDGSVGEMWADQQLLLRSAYFIGNPLSTFSVNIARVRALVWGHTADAHSNLRPGCHILPDQGSLYRRRTRPAADPSIDARSHQ